MLKLSQFNQLIKNGSKENYDNDHFPVVKLFINGSSFTWLLTQIDSDNCSTAFGLCDLGAGFPELENVNLRELQFIKNSLGVVVERDLNFEPKCSISVYARAARFYKRIIEDQAILKRFDNN